MPGGTEWITDLERLTEIAGDWDRMAQHDPAPFSRQAWIVPWWRAFGAGRALRVCAVWDGGGELAAALPLCARGRRLEATANTQTPAYRPLARDAAARERLADALLEGGAEVAVPALPAEEPEVRAVIAAVERRGGRSVLEPDYVSPVQEITGSFDDYRSTMKSRWREVERRARKMAREHEVEEAFVAAPVDLERELSEGLELEAAGWKGRSGTAMLSTESTATFYREIARTFHAAGELRLSSLRMDGQLVAFDLALVHAARYFLLKTAYNEELRTLAPGLVLRRAVIERCFELGLAAHEFLGVDMEWKRLFATGERVHYVWQAYPRRPASSLRYAYRRHARPHLKRAYVRARRRA